MTSFLKMYCQSLFILIVVLQATLVFGGIRSHDGQDKTGIDPSYLKFSDGLISKHKIGPKTLSALKEYINVNTSPIKTHFKSKVNRNQFGIINMLWSFPLKKLSSTSNYYSGHSLFRLPSRPKSIVSTPSHIEYYYLKDETDASAKKVIKNNQQLNDEKALEFRGRYRRNMRKEIGNNPILAFLINDPNYKRLPRQSNDLIIPKSQTPSIVLLNNLKLQNCNYSTLINTIKYEDATANKIVVNNERLPAINTVVTLKRSVPEHYQVTSKSKLTSNWPTLTTVYDKIKFFEMYDNNTPFSNNMDTINVTNTKNVSSNNNLNNDSKLKLKNGDEGLQHKNSSTEKTKVKEIYFKRNRKDLNSEKSALYPARFYNHITTKEYNRSPIVNIDITTKEFNRPPIVDNNGIKNLVAGWSEYSFMAAYIHEPKQILCDAAAISPHWLVTSGSCLSKRQKDPGEEGRSAYVAYCDSSWWNAERRAYVKYSIVHPRYSENYTRRRNMYNMGLIQVVISMATCISWAPVALISHKFIIPPAGSKAYAVGWGLERYNTRAAKSARNPLTVYESKLFQNSCLNKFISTSSDANNNAEDLQNLYCLPYSGEASAPVLGSMLLIEGKLCGIYLQEQQHSAQYSSVWRLGPWVSNVAREFDDS